MKRLICLVLSLCLLAALAVTPAMAAAPTFTDSDMVSNVCAVEMLTDLGIISGYPDGSFRPRATITRQAAAKIVALLLEDDFTDLKLEGFSDVEVESQFAPYIYYCYNEGIISGANGNFNPGKSVTPRALAKMLLGALGYDTTGYSGTGWADRVDKDARAAGIYDGFYDYYDQPITRDNACLLIFNAMQSYVVDGYDAAGKPVYHLDALMNPQTMLEMRYGVVRYTELLIANEWADMTRTDSRLGDGYSQLEHHRALAVSTDLRMLGREIVLYAKNGEVLGVPTYSPYEGYYTFDDFADFADVLIRLGLTRSADTLFYYNFNLSDSLTLVRAGENVEITIVDHTGDGVLDVVLMIEYHEATVVSNDEGLTAKLSEEGEPFVVVTAGETSFAEGDTITVAYIGGRYLLKEKSE